jgi:altronate hydrolase
MTTEQQAGCSIRLPEQSSAAQLAVLQVHQRDNVLVALQALQAGEPLPAPFSHLSAQTAVPAGHKLALTAIAAGEPVLKYGFAIGRATQPIAAGEHVHSHNLATALSGTIEYSYAGCQAPALSFPADLPQSFQGYRRSNGKVGTRNELWIINTVGCVNRAAMRVAEQARQHRADDRDVRHGAPGDLAIPEEGGIQVGNIHAGDHILNACAACIPLLPLVDVRQEED